MSLPGHPLDPDAPLVIAWRPDGSYDWVCRGCGQRCERYPPHRGPRRSYCRSCQNVRAYRKRNPLAQRRSRPRQRYEGWRLNYRDMPGGLD